MLSYIHPRSVLLDSTTPFKTTRVTQLLSKKIWLPEATTYDCYFYRRHSPPNFEKTGTNIEQTTGRKRMKDVHYSAEKFTSENANEPVKRVVGCGGYPLDGHARADISIRITKISTIGKCPVLPKRMKAELAAILSPTHSRFILGVCLEARLPRAPSLLQRSHRVTGVKRVHGHRVHEVLRL